MTTTPGDAVATVLFEGLGQAPLFRDVPEEQLRRCAAAAAEVRVAVGEVLVQEGTPSAFFYVLLEGELQITKLIGGRESVINTYRPGTFFGELPILLDSPYVASGRAVEPSRLARFSREAFWDMLQACPHVLRTVLRKMGERIQQLESVSQEQERLAGLGTLAAGLAHELNNPAAAGRGAARQLREAVPALQQRALGLQAERPLDALQVVTLGELQNELVRRLADGSRLDPLARSGLEDEVGAWLEAHGVDDGWRLAPTLASAGADSAWLDRARDRLGGLSLAAALDWLEATLAAVDLTEQVEHSTARISELVEAMREYTYLDRAPRQEIDVHEGLDSTLVVLGARLRAGGVTVAREYDRALPRIWAHGPELNRVWTNLLDNAIDAAGQGGRITIRTAREPAHVLVEVRDDGTGIAPEVMPRIFEPFFTTKGVGGGTGLGLHASYRIVTLNHHGDLTARSSPGDTRFEVRLPIGTAAAAAEHSE